MLRPLTIVLFGAAFLVAACSDNQEQSAASETPAAPVNAGPPGLWAVELIGADGAIAASSRVCDDGSLGAVFARSLPTVGEQTCTLVDPLVVGPDPLTARCKAGDVEYVAATDPQGDLTRVFSLDTVVKASAPAATEYKQTARVRRVGECPTDWTYGDAAAPGSHDITNVLTGATKTASNVR